MTPATMHDTTASTTPDARVTPGARLARTQADAPWHVRAIDATYRLSRVRARPDRHGAPARTIPATPAW